MIQLIWLINMTYNKKTKSLYMPYSK
ncbi:hypothetical protein F383_10760 [Gossypium arboreum]|uniref:Uncharacterized protein n=1 Tax=Gossypium arboreum TaxID=29729 RepID=A0A0B0PND2_GOSAR|nr:hypothetical protein F383_10760 [Gossypium arboreum]